MYNYLRVTLSSLLISSTIFSVSLTVFSANSYAASPVTLCNPLAEIACGLPFPSDLYLDSETLKLNYSDEVLDTRVSGPLRGTNTMLDQFPDTFRPSAILNNSAGFSPLGAIFFELEGMPTAEHIENLSEYLLVYDLDTGNLVNMVVTLSPMALSKRSTRTASSVIAAWPRSRFEFEHRFVAILLKGIEQRKDGLAQELAPSDGVVSLLAGGGTDEVNNALAPIISFINDKGIKNSAILSFTHFTIRPELEITTPLMTMIGYVTQNNIKTTVLDEYFRFMGSEEFGDKTLTGSITLVNFRSEDGGVYAPFEPVVNSQQEETDFILSMPKWDESGAIAIQVIGHGLASDKTVVDADFSFAQELGMAALIIDWPNHGSRVWVQSPLDGSDQSAYFPQVVEVCASGPIGMMQFLGMFVQGAVDLVAVVHGVNTSLPATMADYSSELPVVDPNRIVYKGGSFGAMIGSMVGAISPELKGAYISTGTGSLMHALSESTFWGGGVGNLIPQNISGAEAAFVLGMMQQYIDIADSLNFADYYRNPPQGLNPRKLSLSYAIDDGVMPNAASLAFAELVDLPMLKEIIRPESHISYGVEGIEDHIDGYGVVHAEYGETDAMRAIEELMAFDNDRYAEVIESNPGFENALSDFVSENSELVDTVGQIAGIDFSGIVGGNSTGDNVVESLISEVYLGESKGFITHWARSVYTRRAKINWHCEVLSLNLARCADAVENAALDSERDESEETTNFSDLNGIVDLISDFEGFEPIAEQTAALTASGARRKESGGAFGIMWVLLLSFFGLARKEKNNI